MIVTIQTQDPDVVTAPRIAELIEAGGFYVEQVTINGCDCRFTDTCDACIDAGLLDDPLPSTTEESEDAS